MTLQDAACLCNSLMLLYKFGGLVAVSGRCWVFAVSRRFCQTLKRLTSLNHLCQAARSVVHSADVTSQMLYDWSRVDLPSICKQTIYTMDKYCERDYDMIVTRESTVTALSVFSPLGSGDSKVGHGGHGSPITVLVPYWPPQTKFLLNVRWTSGMNI